METVHAEGKSIHPENIKAQCRRIVLMCLFLCTNKNVCTCDPSAEVPLEKSHFSLVNEFMRNTSASDTVHFSVRIGLHDIINVNEFDQSFFLDFTLSIKW